MILYEYPKCSTCQKSKKYLELKSIPFKTRNIVEEKLSIEEISNIIEKSHKDINKFFNTSGIKYRELDLKNKLPLMSYEEKLKILSSDGMLIKRPILELSNDILIGFKEKEWETKL